MSANGPELSTYLDRRRGVLISVGDLVPLHRDLELHLLSIGVRHEPAVLQLLKDGLSALALYMVSRPRFETFGWTVSLQSPPRNLFFTASAREETIIGRAFLEGVQPAPRNLFFAQVTRPAGEVQTSSVEVAGEDLFSIVEQYCRLSDQQVVRYIRGEKGTAAFLSALPEGDKEWIPAATADDVLRPGAGVDRKLLSTRTVTFRCGCDRDRITSVVANLYRDDPADLFRGDPSVEAECPRCGTRHTITRPDFDAALSRLTTTS
jgi:molecular chaperone Hsp33